MGVDVAGGKGSDVTAGGCSRAGGFGSTAGAPPSVVPVPVVPVPVVLDPVLVEPVVDEEDDVVVVELDEPEAAAVLAAPFPSLLPPPQPPNVAAMASPISMFLLAFIFRPRPVCRRIGR